MSDDLKKAVQEMRQDLAGVQQSLHAAAGRFDTFLVRFDEVVEMLVNHDTEQLKRVIAVENENAVLKQSMDDVLKRLEVLEKRAS